MKIGRYEDGFKDAMLLINNYIKICDGSIPEDFRQRFNTTFNKMQHNIRFSIER